MKQISLHDYIKKGRTWEESFSTTDQRAVYQLLAQAMIRKYVHRAAGILRVMERNNYDGTRTVTIYYDSNCKSEYTVLA